MKHDWLKDVCLKCGRSRVIIEGKWVYFPNLPGHPVVVDEEGDCPQTKFNFEEWG